MLELYFKYHRVIARFRSGALGNKIACMAADLSKAGYKTDSAKLYLARIARFSAYATECGCSRSTPVPLQIVDRYLQARPTTAARWAAHGAICFAARCSPELLPVRSGRVKASVCARPIQLKILPLPRTTWRLSIKLQPVQQCRVHHQHYCQDSEPYSPVWYGQVDTIHENS